MDEKQKWASAEAQAAAILSAAGVESRDLEKVDSFGELLGIISEAAHKA